jgi:hypothetical protein
MAQTVAPHDVEERNCVLQASVYDYKVARMANTPWLETNEDQTLCMTPPAETKTYIMLQIKWAKSVVLKLWGAKGLKGGRSILSYR